MLCKRSNKKGFTLAETLLVVAIVIILAALAMIAIIAYQRNMTKLEYDGYAREIFIAAQNHLTMAESQGYLGRDDSYLGIEDPDEPGVYYYVVNVSGGTSVTNEDYLLNLMLPTASIDDTVRLSGCYIVRYHKDSATVLDVFYWTPSGSRFSHTYSFDPSDYITFMANRTNKSAMRRYGSDKSVIGWYGGADAEGLPHGEPLKAPSITVVNAEALYVTVSNPNSSGELQIIITGKTSGKSARVDPYKSYDAATGRYYLDDITADINGGINSRHFADLFPELIPGEDIEIQAKVLYTDAIEQVAVSAKQTTNSLFVDGTTADTAKIAYFRHLENLDNNTSSLSYQETNPIHITKAEQIADLKWAGFTNASDPNHSYLPVSPDYALQYNGKSDGRVRSISSLTVSSSGSAGVFGELSGGKVENLKLIDLTVSGTDAGALAGKTSGTAVANVAAYNSSNFDKDHTTATVSGSGSVGGLIGEQTGGSVSKCAAALLVKSTGGDAGGLIGSASGTATISNSYSGGHTDGGAYSASAFNVTASGYAGGLVGSFSGSSITDSYSTCSASGSTVGGFAGTAGGSLIGCYATGLVSGATAGAFAGTLSGTATGCQYYQIVNEMDKNGLINKNDPNYGKDGFLYLNAVSGQVSTNGITPLDLNAKEYQVFVGAPDGWEPAAPYDTQLYLYKGSYSLKGLKGMTGVENSDLVSTHYGDWPAPEIWVINR